MLRPHVVILGAGFGGTYVAKRLSRYVKREELDITIVNKTNYFLFTPLLHEVATGSLTPTSVAEPLREIFHGSRIELCQGRADSIDTVNRRVHVVGNGMRHTLPYDYLVIATGSSTNFYGIPGADMHTMPLKDLSDAAKIRDKMIDSFEEAIFCENPEDRARMLSFAVIGGGPTGVELAAEMAEFTQSLVKRYYNCTNASGSAGNRCTPEEPRVTLIDAGLELIPRFPTSLRNAAKERLESSNVILKFGEPVTQVTSKGLTLQDGESISASSIIWTAGVSPILPDFINNHPEVSHGRLSIDEYFRVGGDERVFALGDVAGYVEPQSEGTTVPMLAQAAVQEARTVAKNIVASATGKKLRRFKFRSKGLLVSVGQWFAVGEIFTISITGKFTWWLWRTVYLFKFASWKKRIRIAFEWTLNIFYPRDITKLG